MFVNVLVRVSMKMCPRRFRLQFLAILPNRNSIWSVEDIEPQEEVVVPVVASQSTLPEEAWRNG